MSGFEIAGIVLALFPLAVGAAKTSREKLSHISDYRSLQCHNAAWESPLKTESIFFEQHVKRMMRLVVDSQTEARLMAGEGWEDFPDDRLEEKLGTASYAACLRSIEGIEKALKRLQEELEAHENTVKAALDAKTGNQEPPSMIERVRLMPERIKFMKYKREYIKSDPERQRLFEQLRNDNKVLKELVSNQYSEELLSLAQRHVRPGVPTKAEAALCRFWLHATKLFLALSKVSRCGCDDNHLASLLLQHRSERKAEFTMLFTASGATRWTTCRVKILEGDTGTTQPRLPEPAPTPILHSPAQPPATAPQPALTPTPILRAVLQSARAPARPRTPTGRPVVTVMAPASPFQGDPTERIKLLCTSLEQTSRPCCGYIDLHERDTRFYMYPMNQVGQAVDLSRRGRWITLEQVLQIRRVDEPPVLSQRSRYFLSLVLASSFLQLLQSPWLQNSIDKSAIVFAGDPATASGWDLERPHILQQFRAISDAETGPFAGDMPQSPVLPSDSFQQLGITLLEVFFCDVLERQKWRRVLTQDMGPRGQFVMDVGMATANWLRPLEEQALAPFVSVVKWCLGGSLCADPERWRRQMLERVVQPLKSCHDLATGAGLTQA